MDTPSATPPTIPPTPTMAFPTPNYSADPAELCFRHALNLLRESWIREFLLPLHSIYAEQLEQTLLQPRRVTADMVINTINPTDAFALNEKYRVLLLPSFSTGPISVSYQVISNMTSNLCLYQKPYIARCVRDDVNGIFLTIAELPDSGFTEITCCSQHSPGFRDRVFMIAKTKPFRQVMDALSSGYDAEKLKAGLVYSFHSCEIRHCPTCNEYSVSCTCPLKLVRKKHPMDFDTDLYNLRSFLGSYDGISHQAIYERGVNMYNGMHNTRATVEFSYDTDARRELETWALEDTLKGRSYNFRMLAMPSFGPVEQDVEFEDIDQALSSGADDSIADGKNDEVTWSPFSDDVDDQAMQVDQFMFDGNAQEHTEFPGLGMNSLDVTGMRNRKSLSTSSMTLHGSQERHQSTSLSVSKVSTRCLQPLGNQIGNGTQSIPETQQPQEPHAHGSVVTSTMPTSHPVTQPVSQPLAQGFDEYDITRPKRIGRPPAPKIRVARRMVPIVPATEATAAAGVQKAILALTEEARRKVELRKARNRASAIRSNEKKKRQIQKLKDSLQEAREREATLRKEERSLREANLKLRAKLSG